MIIEAAGAIIFFFFVMFDLFLNKNLITRFALFTHQPVQLYIDKMGHIALRDIE